MPEPSNASSAVASNLRKTNVTSLIRQYLSALVPGYSVFAELLSSRLGVDSDKILAIVGFFFAGWASVTYLKNTVIPHISSSFTSTLTVKVIGYGHPSLSEWLHSHGALKRSRLIWASGWAPVPDTNGRNPRKPKLPPSLTEDMPIYSSSGELFNYSKSKASKPIEWAPENGVYFFTYRWRPFLVQWSKVDDANSMDRGLAFFKLFTLGNSTKPLEDLVQNAVEEKLASRLGETTVWRASGSQWSNSAQRIARPLNTISLEQSLKSELVNDLNAYLQPGRHSWYAARGVPYRRGYLFWGPPGCGKTSLAFSLAGTFGLDIYIANLTSGYGINEDDLQYLVNDLPDRCILVIEDIDAIAVDREKAKNDPAFRNKTKDERQAFISLSGLLNALDGMFAKEGRLLVMTTNFKDYLDPAILRPGRVDKQIRFGLMTRTQIADIFVRMFGSVHTDRTPPASVEEAIKSFQPDVSYPGCPYDTADELRAAGKAFADKFPEQTFSPAQLQEYLIESFEDPQQAIDGADEWVERELVRKKEKEERQRKEFEEADKADKAEDLDFPPPGMTGGSAASGKAVENAIANTTEKDAPPEPSSEASTEGQGLVKQESLTDDKAHVYTNLLRAS